LGILCFRRLFFVLAFLLISPVLSHADGRLEFQEKIWNFGKLESYNRQTHTFKFTNTGDSEIEIVDVITSCGCTAAIAGQSKIGKGERGEIRVSFNPVGQSGQYKSDISVYVKGVKDPYTLVIKADLSFAEKFVHKVKVPAPEISVTPGVVDLGNVEFGKTVYYKVIVGNSGDGDLFIRNFDVLNESSGLPLSKKGIGKGKRVELTGYFFADVKGAIHDFLVIRSNDPITPLFRIRIIGTVK